jgi:hypothetical protein
VALASSPFGGAKAPLPLLNSLALAPLFCEAEAIISDEFCKKSDELLFHLLKTTF